MPIIGGNRRDEPPLRSASAIVASTESGHHLLRIDGYTGTKIVPTGSYIRSRSFRVGRHSWHIRYFPNGSEPIYSDYISIFLKLDDHHNPFINGGGPLGVRARFTFSLLDHVHGEDKDKKNHQKPVPYYSLRDEHTFRDHDCGFHNFISRYELERSEHLLLKNDCFTIRCDLTVVTGNEIQTMDLDVDRLDPTTTSTTGGGASAMVAVAPPPPSDLHRHLGRLLATGDGVDVAFQVGTRTFSAHRCVLMARSPVFHAQLSALSSSSGSTLRRPPTTPTTPTTIGRGGAAAAAAVNVIKIEDMEAEDFEAFLHYVYTDTLPPETTTTMTTAAAMLQDLVAAANRYHMERLRLVCEARLSELVDATTVILEFAVDQRCLALKEACLRFLQDPANLREFVNNTDGGLEPLSRSCPSVLKDIIAKLAAADGQEPCSYDSYRYRRRDDDDSLGFSSN